MRITVKAKPMAFEDRVEKLPDGSFVVSVTEPPMDGRANRAIVALLADHFKIPKANVRIASGHASRQKMIEIDYEKAKDYFNTG